MKKITILLLAFALVFLHTFVCEAATQWQKGKKTGITKKTKQKNTARSKKSKKTTSNPPTKKQINSQKGSSLLTPKVSNSDTNTIKEVIITSAFKPALQFAAKINFTAASVVPDSSTLSLQYTIPSYNLYFTYVPVPITPVAIGTDSIGVTSLPHSVKLEAGNLSTLSGSTQFMFGDLKKKFIQLNANFLTISGKQFAQDYRNYHIGFKTLYKSPKNLMWTTKGNFDNKQQYLYGFRNPSVPYSKSQLRQSYTTLLVGGAVQNLEPNEHGISIHPSIEGYSFSDDKGGTEYSLILHTPIQKKITKLLTLDIQLTADWSTAKSFQQFLPNHIFQIHPALHFNTPNFRLKAGLQPTWEKGQYHMLPNFTFESILPALPFSIEAGWVGSIQKNNFRSLYLQNPWISQPTELQNTKETDIFIGILGRIGHHFNYRSRVSFLQWKQKALFVNDAYDGKYFVPIYENKINAIKIFNEIAFNVQQKFSVTASNTIYQFNTVEENFYAWGMLPIELNANARWMPQKDIQFIATFFASNGSLYRGENAKAFRTPAAFDLSIGTEFLVYRKVGITFQLNNLLNNQYQRWNQYPVFGFQITGGVVYSFK